MPRLTAANLVRAISVLDRNINYNYINPRTRGLIKIVNVHLPEGPIEIKRWNPANGETERDQDVETISSEMIWRVANAVTEEHPINLDRVLAGSYNTRSVLEALLAYTSEFYYCYPGRIEIIAGRSSTKRGHKHLIWKPTMPHTPGVLNRADTNLVISEIPQGEVMYEEILGIPSLVNEGLDIEVARRHAQIQIALFHIGHQLNYRTWIAQNDTGIEYNGRLLREYDGIIRSLRDENLFVAFQQAAHAARMIDCIWFKNGRLMPAVMEVEHSTGVTSGLTRMKNFKDNFIPLENVRWVIVAEDGDRDRVIQEANKEQFRSLNTRFFPYSAVEELYWLCQNRRLRGVTEDFLDCFMEPVLN